MHNEPGNQIWVALARHCIRSTYVSSHYVWDELNTLTIAGRNGNSIVMDIEVLIYQEKSIKIIHFQKPQILLKIIYWASCGAWRNKVGTCPIKIMKFHKNEKNTLLNLKIVIFITVSMPKLINWLVSLC